MDQGKGVHQKSRPKTHDHTQKKSQKGLQESRAGMEHKSRKILYKCPEHITGSRKHKSRYKSCGTDDFPEKQKNQKGGQGVEFTGDVWKLFSQW